MFKRFSGLCAIITAMSLFVAGFPVAAGADDGNLIGDLNCGFETGDLTGWNTNTEPQVTAQAARTGNYGAELVVTESGRESNLRYVNRLCSNNQEYIFAGYVKAGDASSLGKSVKVIAQRSGGGKTTHGTAVRLTDEWQKISVIYSYSSESGQNYKVHIGLYADAGAVIYADDFELREYVPAELSVTASVENINPTGASIKYTFSSPLVPGCLNAEAFTVTGGSAGKELTGDGNVYTLTLSELESGTDYVVTLTGTATGTNGANVTGTEVTFKTSESIPEPEEKIYDFETGEATPWNTNVGITVSSQTARSGSYGASYVSTGDNFNMRLTGVPYENGKTYVFSGYVKTDSANAGKTIRLTAQQQGSSKVKKGNGYSLTADWQKIEIIFNLEDQSSIYKVHLGVLAESGATVFADDFELKEFVPAELSVTTSVENVSATGALIKYTFSNPIVSDCLSAEAFTVTGGNADKKLTGDDKVYTLTLSGLTSGTEYSVTLTGTAADAYGGAVTGTVVTFVTSESVTEPEEKIYDFETGEVTPWNTNVQVTVSSQAARSGSYGASYVSTGDNSNMRLTGIPYEDGKTYVFWGYIKTDKAGAGKTVRLTAQQQGGGTTQKGNSYTLTTSWQRVSIVFTVNNQTSNYRVHLGVQADSGATVFADDFTFSEYDKMSLIYSNPENNRKRVSISQPVILTFNNKIDDDGILVRCFKLNGKSVKSAVLLDDGKTISVEPNGMLKPNTAYTLTVKDVKDIYGGTVSSFKIEFETGGEVAVSNNPVIYKNGIAQSQLTEGEFVVKSTVQNSGKINCEKPVMIVASYDADGFLIDVKSTEFGGMLGYEPDSNTLELDLPITITSDAAYVTVHMWKSADDISYMQAPVKMTVQH